MDGLIKVNHSQERNETNDLISNFIKELLPSESLEEQLKYLNETQSRTIEILNLSIRNVSTFNAQMIPDKSWAEGVKDQVLDTSAKETKESNESNENHALASGNLEENKEIELEGTQSNNLNEQHNPNNENQETDIAKSNEIVDQSHKKIQESPNKIDSSLHGSQIQKRRPRSNSRIGNQRVIVSPDTFQMHPTDQLKMNIQVCSKWVKEIKTDLQYIHQKVNHLKNVVHKRLEESEKLEKTNHINIQNRK